MDRSYKFAIVRFAPDDIRGERLNIGVVIIGDESLDVRPSRRLEKVKAISAALDCDVLRNLLDNLKGVDEQGRGSGFASLQERIDNLSRIGPLSLSQIGTFVAEDSTAYEERVASILNRFVEPEPAPVRPRRKKTRLLTQIRRVFQRERVLARRDEGLDSHRIVSDYPLDEGLVADLVLRNSAYHVVETVDASGDEHSFRKTISEIAVSALVIERARMRFGESAIKARLVYTASSVVEKAAQPSLEAAANQGAELVNWASDDDRSRFVHSLSILATPFERNRKMKFVTPTSGGLFQ